MNGDRSKNWNRRRKQKGNLRRDEKCDRNDEKDEEFSVYDKGDCFIWYRNGEGYYRKSNISDK